jgi:hypothetical protein
MGENLGEGVEEDLRSSLGEEQIVEMDHEDSTSSSGGCHD